MHKKYFFGVGFMTALLVASVLLLKSTPGPVAQEEKSTCCKKNPTECKAIKTEEAGPSTPLESLSHQFIAFPVLVY